MRAALAPLVACAALAAGASEADRVSSTPPSVSLRVSGNDVPATNEEAQNYCARYGHAAQYRGVQGVAEGEVAVYTCDGAPASALNGTPAPSSGSTVPPGTARGAPVAPR
jgi:hypothetical protein